MNVLIINAGSSSLKYQLMDPETGAVSAKGLCERIYIDGRLTHNANGKKIVKDIPMPTHSEAIQAVLAILVDPVDGVIKSTDEIDAVGHRVLHGGHAQDPSGRRVRYRFPHDHAPQGLPLRHSHRVLRE